MTMMTHAHNPQLLQDHRSSITRASNATSHLAMIKRFVKFVLMVVLFAVAVTAIMAIRVVAWLPPLHH